MRSSQRRIVAACADTMFPPGGPIPVSGTEAGLVEYFDAYVAQSSFIQRILFSLLLLFIQLSPFVFGPWHGRFTALSPDDRTRVLKRMEASKLIVRRGGFLSLRLILTNGYFACPAVAAAIMRKPHKEVSS